MMRPSQEAKSGGNMARPVVAAMQPNLFPYLGYINLIARADIWVVLDFLQYTKNGWMNRNRILHPARSWQYVTVPVHSAPQKTKINQIRFISDSDVALQLIGKLNHYRIKRAPYYSAVVQLVESTFSRTPSDLLWELSINSIAVICEYLALPFAPVIGSEHNFNFSAVKHSGQWTLEIASQLGAGTYINPPNGRAIYVAEEFHERGMELAFIRAPSFTYDCAPYSFIPHLSMLDVLMWCSPEQVREQFFTDPIDYA
ncbi:WbqC family protein [Desulfovibrio sp. OttesenSCG-928-A18]|nr:WbqC family protein [Desulfovibrio sp. OttesenSCG-928-A18]